MVFANLRNHKKEGKEDGEREGVNEVNKRKWYERETGRKIREKEGRKEKKEGRRGWEQQRGGREERTPNKFLESTFCSPKIVPLNCNLKISFTKKNILWSNTFWKCLIFILSWRIIMIISISNALKACRKSQTCIWLDLASHLKLIHGDWKHIHTHTP